MHSTSTRRTVVKGAAGLLAVGAMNAVTPVIGGTRAAGGAVAEPAAAEPAAAEASWTRLYQGTAAVTITYLTELDRVASGTFGVDVRFGEPATVATGGAPFQFDVRTTDLRDGNFVVQENTNPYSSAPPLIEGTVQFSTERTSQFQRPVGLWNLTYAPATGAVSGTFVESSNQPFTGNTIYKLDPFLNGYSVGGAAINTQSRCEGTVVDDRLDLQFDVVDVGQTISASVRVTADRVA